MAVAKAQEDLPSPCLALVNIRLRGRPWDDTSMSDERSDEKVSDIRLFGQRTSCSIAKPSCLFGMAPSEGIPSLRPTSSGVRMTLTSCPRPTTNSAAKHRPDRTNNATLNNMIGSPGWKQRAAQP